MAAKKKRRKRKLADSELAESIASLLKLASKNKAGRRPLSKSYSVIDAAMDLKKLGVSNEMIRWIWSIAQDSEKRDEAESDLDQKLQQIIKGRSETHAEQHRRKIAKAKEEIAKAREEYSKKICRDRSIVESFMKFFSLVRERWPNEAADHYLQTLVTQIAKEKRTNKNWISKVKEAFGQPGPGSVYLVLSNHIKLVTKKKFEPEGIRKRIARA